MDNENIESLLERLVDLNEQTVSKLDDLQDSLADIVGELNWTRDSSFAKMTCEGLNDISSKLDSVKSGLSSIGNKPKG